VSESRHRRSIILTVLVLILLTLAGLRVAFASPVAGAQDIAWHGQAATVAEGHIILKFKPGVAEAARQAVMAGHGLTELAREDRIGAHLMKVPALALEQVLSALARDPAIEYAEPDFQNTRQIYPVPNDPLYQQAVTPGFGQFALVNTQTDRAWNDPDLVGSKGDLTEVLAILDTGIYYPHADFAIGGGDTRILTSPTGPGPVLGPGNIVGWDFANNDNDPLDDNGHGTHVAGIMGATADNGIGVAGMTWYPKLMPVKVMAAGGYGYDWWIISGLFFARDNGAQVINMSLGSSYSSSAEASAVKAVSDAGVVIVAASGNSGGPVAYPAAYPQCIAVGSVKNNDQWAYYSCFGPPLDVTAPGEGFYPIRILSTWNNGGYLDEGGTSMASPHVAGLAGLLLGQNPDWAPETVYRRLTQTADKVPPPAGTYNAAGWNMYMGYGRINTYHALGGIDSASLYISTLYLRDSMTTLSAAVGTNPVARHQFPAGTPGTVAFSLTADDRDSVGVTTATVRVTDPAGGTTLYPLNATPVTSRVTQYDATAAAPLAFAVTTLVPDALLTDAGGRTTRIPLPAYTVPAAAPVLLEASATPNPGEVATTSTISVIARDGSGHPIYGVPIRAVLVSTPGPGASLSSNWGTTGGALPAFQPVLTLSTVEGNHLLVFSISATGLTGIATTLTVTGITAMFVHKDVQPLPACAGNLLTYAISWSRAGAATAFNLVVTDTLPNGTTYRSPSLSFFAQSDGLGTPALTAAQYAATTAGPWFAGEPPDGTGQPLVLRWNVNRVAPGASGFLQFAVSASSTLPTGAVVANRAGVTVSAGGRVYFTNTATASMGTGGSLRTSAAAPVHVTLGQWFTVSWTVTNSGGSGVSVDPALTPGPGAGLVTLASGPVPPGPLVLGAGLSQTFRWTYSAAGTGLAVFTVTAAGAPCAAIVATGIQAPAVLVAQGFAWPSTRDVGQTFKVTFTVTNVGGATAAGVLPAPLQFFGSGAAAVVSGPTPSGPVVLPGGGAVTFTWTYTGTAPGFAGFSTTVAGTDQNTGAALTSGPVASSTLLIQAPAVLAAGPPVATPDPVCIGSLVTITLTVTNTGDATANNVTGSPLLALSGSGAAVLASSPGAVASLAGGAATTLVWTYSATAAGTVTFTATVTATDANTGGVLTTGPLPSNAVTIQAAGSLAAALAAPTEAAVGQWITVNLTVTNTGVPTVTGITPSPLVSASPPLLTLISGPVPSGPVTLVTGGATTFVWTYSVAGSGLLTLTATATGATLASGCPVTVSASAGMLGGSSFLGCGNVYGSISTVAGTGAAGYNGDGVAAITAQINSPYGLAVDSAGNIFIVDNGNQRIRKVSGATGLISTVAGTGVAGYGIDGGAAVSTTLNAPSGIALDGAGNLYISDKGNQRICKVNAATGVISTVAGNGIAGYSGDGIPATTAKINDPFGLAVDSAGNLYIAEYTGSRVRKVAAATGLISTVAGNGAAGYNGDGIAATAAQVNMPYSVAVDAAGNLYIGDNNNNRIRRINGGTGLISTVAGTGVAGFNGDGIAATAAQVHSPFGMVFDGSANLFFADYVNQRVRKIDAGTGLISTIAGTGTAGYNGDGIAASTAWLNYPDGVGFDGAFHLFVSEVFSHRVRRVDPGGGLVASLAVLPGSVIVGSPATVTLTLTNLGCSAVTSVTPSLALGPGGTLASIATGPTPSSVASLASGYGATFTWTLNTVGVGSVALTATGYGTDILSAATVSATATGTLTILPPAGAISCTPVFLWSRTYNGAANGNDAAYGVALDAAGNLVVGGYETVTGQGLNWLVKKYDSSGSLLWSQSFNDPLNGDDVAYGSAFDSAGNELVVGSSRLNGNASNNFFLMQKYNPAGGLLWSRTYTNALGGSDCAAYAVAVDLSGNMVAGGWEQYAGSSYRWQIRKYDLNGALLWSRTFANPIQRYDRCYGMATDPVSGAVIAVGDEEYAVSTYRSVVRKYDSAGSLLWSTVWTGPTSTVDGVHGVAVDLSGSIYVAGHTIDSGQGYDWLVQKYSPAGALIWSVVYNGAANGTDMATALSLDGAGNLVVAGYQTVAGQLDWLIRRYRPDGTFLNSYSYNSPANSDDYPQGVAASPTGTFVAAGLETRTDLAQNQNWLVRMYGAGAGLGASVAVIPGSVLVGTPATVTLTVTNYGCSTVAPVTPSLAMGPGGSLASIATGPTPASVASLASGYAATFTWTLNTLASGIVTLTATGTGIDSGSSSTVWASAAGTLVILPPAGAISCTPVFVWSRTQNGTSNGNDIAEGITIAVDGSVVVSGYQTVAGDLEDWLLRKYDSTGNVLWSQSFNDPFNGTDIGVGVTIDPSGNIVQAGGTRLYGNGSNSYFLTRMFTTAGALTWSRTYTFALVGADCLATAVASDTSGNIAVCGWEQYLPGSYRWRILKYDPAGTLLWSRSYSSPAQGYDRPYGIVADPATGSLVVAGNEERTDLGQSYNWLIRKYDNAGNLLWSSGYTSAGSAVDSAYGIAMDPSGSVYVAGEETVAGQGTNWLVRKYSIGGALIWSVGYNGAANGNDIAYGVTVDAAGNILVTGDETVAGQGLNWLVRRYAPDGTFLNSYSYNSPANVDDSPRGVAASPSGAFAVAGFETRTDLAQNMNWLVRMYGVGASLSASMAVIPGSVLVGTPATVTLTVTNFGCSTIAPVTPSLAMGPGGSLASVATGPTPASVASLASGYAATFTWTLNTLASGIVSLTATGTGIDSGSSSTVWAAAIGTLTITSSTAYPGCVSADGLISTIGGTGAAGYNGDGIAATAAQINQPYGMAVDGTGNVFIADYANNRIRKIAAATGVISTVAGTGTGGFNGDGIPATAAQLRTPQGVTVDAAGNLFICDDGNQRLRKVTAGTGLISTLAGTGILGYNGDGIAATAAQLYYPAYTALDAAGNIYLSDNYNARVRKITVATGIITTVAGTGVGGYNGDGIAATAAQVNTPTAIVFDAAGNWYLCDYSNHRVRKVDIATGIISTVAGTGTAGYNGDGIAATSAQLNRPCGIAMDGTGNFYIAEVFGNRARRVDATTGLISTVAGTGVAGYNGDGIAATTAQINIPTAIALDSSRRIYLVEFNGARARRINPVGGLMAALAVTPGSVAVGTPATVTLTITNVGCATVAPLTPSLAMGPGGSLAGITSGPTPASVASLVSGSSTTFTWILSTLSSGTVYLTATGTGLDTVASSTVWAAATGKLIITDPLKRVLCYGPTAGGLVATTPGITITVWDTATWATKTTAQFAAFDAIAFGDQPACFGSSTIWDTAVATRDVWSPAITGNAIILGNDPDAYGKTQLVHQAVQFAVTGTGTGLYAALSCFYDGTPTAVPVDLLAGLGTFTARQAATVCVDSVHKVAQHVALTGINDAYLSNWACSSHAGFESWPPTFMPVAVALTGSVFAACDGTLGLPVILASGVVPSCPTLVLHKDVSPGSLVCGGSLLTYRISWSNAGGGTIFGLTLTDTLPNGTTYAAPSLAVTASADWLGTPALTASAYAATTAGAWTPGEPPAGGGVPLVMRWVVNRVAPGGSGSLQFQVRVGATLLEGAVIANRASATIVADGRVYPTDEEPTVYRGGMILTKTPSGWVIPAGGPITYTLAYGNSCTDTASNITLWDTLPAGVVFVSASAGGVWDGTKVIWTLPPLAGGGAAAVTVTVSATGDVGLVGPNLAGLTYATSATIWQPTVTSNPVTVTVIAGVPVVHKVVSTVGPVCTGSALTYTISWSNAGAGTIWGLTLLDTIPAGAAYLAPSLSVTALADGLGTPAVTTSAWAASAAGPWTPGEPPTGSPGPLVLRWTIDRIAPDRSGQLSFAATASSTMPAGSVLANRAVAAMAFSTTAYLTETVTTAVFPSGAISAAAASATVVSVGEWITVTLTITNTGGSDLLGLTPSLLVGPGSTLVVPVTGPVPAGPLTLPAAAATTFVWTWSAAGSGLATFTPSATAATCGGGAGLSTALSVSTTIQTPALLAAGLSLQPSTACPGDPVLVLLTVTNTGQSTARGVAAGVPLLTGTGGIAGLTGPTPGFPADLAGGSTMTFTWTCTAASSGSVIATMTVTGADGNGGWPLAASVVSASLDIHATGALAAALAVPSPLSTGQWFAVTLTVTNSGAGAVTGVVPDLTVAPGTPLLTLQSGPVPPGPLVLAAGGAATFTWTYSVSGSGPVGFSATATGIDGCATRLAAGTGAATLETRAALAASLTALPAVRFAGQGILLVLTLSNTGQATATGLAVSSVLSAGTGIATVDAGPWPPLPSTLAGNTVLTFTWTCTAVADGVVDFTTTATAVDADSGAGLAVAPVVSNTVLIQTPVDGLLVRKLQSPAGPVVGGPVTFQIIVANVGTSTMTGVTVTDTVPSLITGVTTVEPAGIGAPVLSQVPATGTRFDWSTGALNFYPGTSWTFTISGFAGSVCTPTPVGNTVLVRADFPVGGATMFTAGAPGFTLLPPVTAVSLALSQTPGTPAIGDAVSYRIVATNTGTATLAALTVTDTVPTLLGGATGDQPAPFGPPLLISVPGGTRFEWSAAGLSMPPGAALTFTVTGRIAAVCAATTVSDTAWAAAASACGATTGVSSAAACLVQPAVFGVTAVTTQAPAAPAAGTTVVYTVVVTNTGAATVDTLNVADTIAPVIMGVATQAPAGFGPPVVTPVASGGTRYGWSGAGLGFAPGASLTFTITGEVSEVCAVTPVTHQAWIGAANGCGATAFLTGTQSFTATPAPLSLTASLIQLPGGSVSTGTLLTYLLTVVNTGQATVTALTVTDTLSPVLLGVTTVQPAVLGLPVITQVAGGTRYVWSGSGLTFGPGAVLSVTITGTVGPVDVLSTVPNSAWLTGASTCLAVTGSSNTTSFTVGPPPPLAISVAKIQTPASPAPGAPVTYRIDVRNTGGTTIVALTVVDTVSPILAGVTAAQPAGFGTPLMIPTPGGTCYVWTATGLTFYPGTALSFTLTGNVSAVCMPATVSNTAWIAASDGFAGATASTNPVGFLAAPPSLFISVLSTVTPASPVSGGPVIYRINVTNSGTATITNLTIVDTVASAVTGAVADQPTGFPAPTIAAAPPSGTRFLWSGSGLTFSPGAHWTFTITGLAGVVTVPTVVDNRAFVYASTGCVTSQYASGAPSFTLLPPGTAQLSAWLTATPASLLMGGTITVVLTVSNVGTAAASGVIPGLVALAGGSLTHRLTGPAPLGPVALAPGGSQAFTWTWNADLDGVVTFTGSATGTDTGFGGTVTASASAVVTITRPPEPIAPGVVKVIVGPRGYVRPLAGEALLVLVRCPRNGQISVLIVTMNGVNVINLGRYTAGGGTERFTWDGRDASGNLVAPGGYVIIVQGPGLARHVSKFAVVR